MKDEIFMVEEGGGTVVYKSLRGGDFPVYSYPSFGLASVRQPAERG